MVAGPLVYVMDMTDRIISKLCPFIAGGIFIGSVYWTAVTYGAVTVMQVNQWIVAELPTLPIFPEASRF